MASFLPSVFIVILLLFTHACKSNARQSAWLNQKFISGKAQIEGKITQNIASVQEIKIRGDIISKTLGDVEMIREKHSKRTMEDLGKERFRLSSLAAPRKATSLYSTQGSTRRALSVVRLLSNAGKAVDPDQNNVQEDSVVMDYDAPHFSTPVHNK